jgi:outer membrane protein
MRIRILAGIFIFIGVSALHAQNARRINLKEALDLAVTNSKQLMLAEASVQQARARVAQAKDKAWPEVKASASYLRINTPNISLQNSGSESGSGSTGSGLGAVFANLHDIGLAQLSVSQPVFAGFRIHNTKLMEQYLADAAQYDATTAKSKVVVNTARALFQYYQLIETQKLIDQDLSRLLNVLQNSRTWSHRVYFPETIG